jgi:hypothetical protein
MSGNQFALVGSPWGAGPSVIARQRNRKGPKGYTRSDERIREDVCDCLMQDWDIDPQEIEVSVNDCQVTLGGAVATRDEKFRAEQDAASVLGVKDVSNNLRVSGERDRIEHESGQSTGIIGAASGVIGSSGDESALSRRPSTSADSDKSRAGGRSSTST